jgi:L-lactate dehydrogenase (cytochrome)
LTRPVSVADYRRLARRRLPRLLSEYIEGGSLTESTLGRNLSDFQDVHLRQRVLGGTEHVSLATEILGTKLSMPVVLAPVGMTGMYARRGEVQAARAARDAGTVACLSTMSICDVREVTAAAGPVWYQLYLLRDRAYMKVLLERVWSLGCRVLVFTVDVAVPGERLREHRQGLAGGLSAAGAVMRAFDGLAHPHWLWDVYLRGRPHTFGNVHEAFSGNGGVGAFWTWVRDALQVSLTPEDIAWVRQNWPGKLLIKGVLDPEDARRAVDAGADGVIVSNHGGRQLDSALSGIKALPRVVEAVGDRAVVMMDGGVRTGEDVVRALALGARGVMIGRAWVYGLAARGETGVAHVLELLRKQMTTTMVLAGCDDVTKAGPDMLA